ncbi:GNAT family N-acetyltransferase [Octadecabacter sp.]|nr:GNAT family N-acetyltransferase [Octadecabacter sp.]
MMDRQPILTDGMFTLRPLKLDGHTGLFVVSDKTTWAGHPSNDRWKPHIFAPYFDGLLGSGETLAIVHGDRIVGCSRFYTPEEDPHDAAIGYTFLHHSLWGGTANRAVKSIMLSHAFAHHDRVWFHIGPSNIRSQKATAKLGAKLTGIGPRTVGGVTSDWLAYTLSKPDWAAVSD